MATANTTIARPYAKAIFEVALAQHQLAQWSVMLQLLTQLSEDPQVASLIKHPALTAAQRGEVLLSIAGKQLDDMGCNLVKVLAQQHRLAVLPQIYALYELERAKQERTIEVEVITAMPLTPAQQQQLSEVLEQRLQRQVTLNIILNKQILGGAIIRAGDWVFDGSVRSKLNALSAQLYSQQLDFRRGAHEDEQRSV